VAWDGIKWVAVGNSNGSVANAQQITTKYSYDGINWSDIPFASPYNTIDYYGFGIKWNGTMFVAVGSNTTSDGRIRYSYDGFFWNSATSATFEGTNPFGYNVNWNGNMWVAVGTDGTPANRIKYSYNGSNWSNSGGTGNQTFTATGVSVVYTTPLNPDIYTPNLNFYTQGVPNYLSTTNQLFATASTLVLNNTMTVYNSKPYVLINSVVPRPTIDPGLPSNALDVRGQMRVTSTLLADAGVFSNTVFIGSDSNIKTDIITADTSLCYSNIKSLPLKRFHYRSDYTPGLRDTTQLGFIAQEVATVFPKSVLGLYNNALEQDILLLNKDQIRMSHYGATQQLIETTEHYQSTFDTCCTDENIVQETSTIQTTTLLISTLSAKYDSLVSNISSLLG
jgi:hypothetical protein